MTALLLVAVVAAAVLAGLAAAVVLLLRDRARPPNPPASAVAIPPTVGKPQVYIALDAVLVFHIYVQLPEAGTHLTVTRTRSSTARIDVTPPVGTVGLERGTDEQVQVEYLPVEYASRAVSIVEQHLQLDNRITSIDLEASNDDRSLQALLDSLHHGADSIGLIVPEDVDASLRRSWTQQSRRIPVATFDSPGEFLRLRAVFTVLDSSPTGQRVLECAWHDRTGVATVRVVIPDAHLAAGLPPGDDPITATCLGVPRWNAAGRVLTLRLISIYESR